MNLQLAKHANLVELLVVHRDPHADRYLRSDRKRDEYGEVECQISPAARYWLGRIHLFGQYRVYAMGREMTRALPSGTEISKGIKKQDPKYVFEVENTSGKS